MPTAIYHYQPSETRFRSKITVIFSICLQQVDFEYFHTIPESNWSRTELLHRELQATGELTTSSVKQASNQVDC